MDFNDAVKSHYYQPVIQDLSGEILANKYPSLAGKCQFFHDGALIVRGQTFNGAVFKKLTISGGATFIGCSFEDCEFHARNEHGENVLSIFGGSLTDCKFRGFYNRLDYLPDYCKGVAFQDGLETLDFSTRFNCAIWDGTVMDNSAGAILYAFIMRSTFGVIPPEGFIRKAQKRLKELLGSFSEALDAR